MPQADPNASVASGGTTTSFPALMIAYPCFILLYLTLKSNSYQHGSCTATLFSAISSSLSAFLRFFRQKRVWIFQLDSLIHRCLKAFIPNLLSCTMLYACLWHISAHLGSTTAAIPPLPFFHSQSNFLNFIHFRSKNWLGISA